MKTILLTAFSILFLSYLAFAQNYDHINGGKFVKRIEYNYYGNAIGDSIMDKRLGRCNTDSKNGVEKLLFGDFNAKVEYFFEPSFDGALGLRVFEVSNSLNSSYVLEVKYISNYKEVWSELEKKYPVIGIPAELFFSVPENIKNAVADKNEEMSRKRQAEYMAMYDIGNITFTISTRLADMLYRNMVEGIDKFRAKGTEAGILDGYNATFRCVSGDEVWSLRIHEPQNSMLELSNLCRGIIKDARDNCLDESKYLQLLKKNTACR